MDTGRMRMLLALAESGSMTTTAKKLHVTQPALTYQINTMEKELGFKVFNRSRTGTSLTREGAYFCETVRSVLAEYEEAVRLARLMARGGERQPVRIGTNIGSRDITTLLLRLGTASLPGVTFNIIPCGSSDPYDLLREGVIDLWSCSSLVMRQHGSSDLRFEKLFEARQMVYVSMNHRLASAKSVSINDLAGETVWFWPHNTVSESSDAIREYMKMRQIDVDIQEYTDNMPAMMSVLAEDTLAVYDDGFLAPASPYVVQKPLIWSGRDEIGLAYCASEAERLSPVLRGIKEFYAQYESDFIRDAMEAAGRIIAVLDDISATVRRGGMKDVVPLVHYALGQGMPAQQILNQGLLAGMLTMSEGFKKGDVYTSEMLAAVSTIKLGAETLKPLLDSGEAAHIMGSAVIGTALGDRHDMGKNIVRVLLESRGIQVKDLGMGVHPEEFITYLKANKSCNLVLISANTDAAIKGARAAIEALCKEDLRDRVFVMLGGAAVSEQLALDMGADAYTADASHAADKAVELLSI